MQIDDGLNGPRFRVNALTGVAQFNQALGTRFDDDAFDTAGGMVTERLGRVPQRGERIEIRGFGRFSIPSEMQATSGQE